MHIPVVTSVYDDAALLPHFLRHYRKLGTTHFLVNVFHGPDNPLWKEVCAFPDVTPVLRSTNAPYSGEDDAQAMNWVMDNWPEDFPWFVVADLDEFHDFNGRQLSELLAEVEAEGADHVRAVFVDRIANDGRFPELLSPDEADIQVQFPLACDLTHCVGGGEYHKMCIVKRGVHISTGHHGCTGQRPFGQAFETHHFKWSAAALSRCLRRFEVLTAQNKAYAVESMRYLRYFADYGMRIPLEDKSIHLRRVCWPCYKGESVKARARRIREGFFECFCRGRGIDIGGGCDALFEGIRVWDTGDGDATLMAGVPDAEYDFVYSSHCLEDMADPVLALQSWMRILKPGGFLILVVPHRDLYEKRVKLPSNWNPNHKSFWLPHRDEEPNTKGVLPFLERTLSGQYDLLYCNVCDEGYAFLDPDQHAAGEYSIETVLRKL